MVTSRSGPCLGKLFTYTELVHLRVWFSRNLSCDRCGWQWPLRWPVYYLWVSRLSGRLICLYEQHSDKERGQQIPLNRWGFLRFGQNFRYYPFKTECSDFMLIIPHWLLGKMWIDTRKQSCSRAPPKLLSLSLGWRFGWRLVDCYLLQTHDFFFCASACNWK